MQIAFKKSFDAKDKFLILPVFEDKPSASYLPIFIKDWLKSRIEKKDFNAKAGGMITYFPDQKDAPEKILVVSFGKEKSLNGIEMRGHIATVLKNALRQYDTNELTLFCPKKFLNFAQEIGEALELGNYLFAKYKTGKEKENFAKKDLKKLNLICSGFTPVEQNVFQKTLEKGFKIGQAVNFVRDLINGPPNLITVDYVADKAKEVATKNHYKLKILDKKQLEKMKMGAILAVNKGSHLGAKLVVIEHLPLGSKVKPILLVGKGILFDTGGYNLKPTQGLDWMHMDMAGAAVVLGTMSLLKQLNIKKNVIGIFPLTDNAVNSEAQKPSEIITSYSGKTIEVGNTDAEGRLVLADAISYGIKTYDPQSIIDLATLTGACRAALGERYAGIFANNDALKDKLKIAGDKTDEFLWHMPIHADHHKAMKSKIADLCNIDMTGLAGASTAAAFIEAFVEKKPWAHLDIAGVTNVRTPKKYETTGATGFGVRLLIDFLEN